MIALGAVPWLPPRGWLTPSGLCPVGGPHVFALYDGPIDAVREVHRMVAEGRS